MLRQRLCLLDLHSGRLQSNQRGRDDFQLVDFSKLSGKKEGHLAVDKHY
jgi:hypothetical protein